MYRCVRDASMGIVLYRPVGNRSVIVNLDGLGVIAVFPVMHKPGDHTAKTSAFAGIGIRVIQKLENVM